MEVIGWIAVGVVAVVAAAAALIGIRSVPDARRYMRMRRM
nr:hypothetical protein CPGR_04203 [Mycolicibacterium malmesburyense]